MSACIVFVYILFCFSSIFKTLSSFLLLKPDLVTTWSNTLQLLFVFTILVTIFMGCHFPGNEDAVMFEGGRWSIGPLPSPPAISSHIQTHPAISSHIMWFLCDLSHDLTLPCLFVDLDRIPSHCTPALSEPATSSGPHQHAWPPPAFAASSLGKHAGGTPRSRLSALKAWHVMHNMEWRGSPWLCYVLNGVHNSAPGSLRRPPQPPINAVMLSQLVQNLDLNSPLDAAVAACATTAF